MDSHVVSQVYTHWPVINGIPRRSWIPDKNFGFSRSILAALHRGVQGSVLPESNHYAHFLGLLLISLDVPWCCSDMTTYHRVIRRPRSNTIDCVMAAEHVANSSLPTGRYWQRANRLNASISWDRHAIWVTNECLLIMQYLTHRDHTLFTMLVSLRTCD